MSYDMLLFLI